MSDTTSSPLLDPNIEPASSEDIQYLEAVEQLKKIVSMFENKSVIGINWSH